MTTSLRIYPHHLHTVPSFTAGRVGFCNKQARVFCEAHGIDWADFVKHGIDAQVLIDTNDALALRVVEHARSSVHG